MATKSQAARALGVTSGFVALALGAWIGIGSCTRTGPKPGSAPERPLPPASSIPEPGPAPERVPPPAPGKDGARNARSAVGYNMDFPGDWTGLPPFIDLMKNARAWSGSCSEAERQCDGVSQLSLDAHGWVRTLRYKDHPDKAYEYVEAVILTRRQQPGFDGDLVIQYDGSGEIDVSGGTVSIRDRERHRIVFHAGQDSVFLRIVATDPQNTGDYLKNIRVFRADQAQALARGELFNPEMLAYLAPFGSLRFMDWMESNQRGVCSGGPEHGRDCYAGGSKCPDGRCVMAGVWAERPRMDQPSLLARSQFLDPSQPGRGVRVGGYPVELLVDLANTVGADPHFNLPAAFEDEYAREFAAYVKAHLAPNLRATVEYSNETWNWGFPQATYVNIKGRQLWPGEGSAWVQYAGSRMQHLCRIWKQVFGEQKGRVRCLISPQTGWPDMARTMLDCPAWAHQHPELGACHESADAVAITGYFAGCLQQPQNEPKLRAWLAHGKAQALDHFFHQLESGNELSCAEPADKNSLADAIELYKVYARIAEARGLELYVYESGTHFNYEGKNSAVEQLFVDATRDPRMGQLYRRNLEAFKQAGGTIMNAWGWIAPHDMWANADNINDREHPKYRALRDFAEQEPCWWERCDRSQR
jgi:hypothetical protein